MYRVIYGAWLSLVDLSFLSHISLLCASRCGPIYSLAALSSIRCIKIDRIRRLAMG